MILPRDRPPKKSPTNSSFWTSLLSKVLLSLSLSLSLSLFFPLRSLASFLLFSHHHQYNNQHSLTQYSLSLYSSHGASESRSLSCASMVVEPNSSSSGMADVPSKASLPRKSAFSCEACRKRKVSGSLYIYILCIERVAHIGWIPIRRTTRAMDGQHGSRVETSQRSTESSRLRCSSRLYLLGQMQWRQPIMFALCRTRRILRL